MGMGVVSNDLQKLLGEYNETMTPQIDAELCEKNHII